MSQEEENQEGENQMANRLQLETRRSNGVLRGSRWGSSRWGVMMTLVAEEMLDYITLCRDRRCVLSGRHVPGGEEKSTSAWVVARRLWGVFQEQLKTIVSAPPEKEAEKSFFGAVFG
ncbi:hypothetical protein C8F01DRAFT_1094925 [Mycena amicta]|nr:hypothetical protein C8F01DRAFT_1094925 [Mycena amicta]